MHQFNALNQLPFAAELGQRQKASNLAQKTWESIAPDNLANISKAVTIKNNQLYLVTQHNAVASKIKFLIPSLLKKLEKLDIELTGIQVKVQVKSIEPTKPKQQKILSKNAAINLNELVDSLEDDSPLAKVLAKLAANAEKNSN